MKLVRMTDWPIGVYLGDLPMISTLWYRQLKSFFSPLDGNNVY